MPSFTVTRLAKERIYGVTEALQFNSAAQSLIGLASKLRPQDILIKAEGRSATSFGADGHHCRKKRFVLALISPKGQAELVDCGQLFQLRREEPGSGKGGESRVEGKREMTREEALDQKKNLVRQFGTSKSKRKLQQFLNNVI